MRSRLASNQRMRPRTRKLLATAPVAMSSRTMEMTPTPGTS
jgi:hypothetical protein